MLIDVTGIILTPGNFGRDCLGNGSHYDENGNPLECCCDECNYMLCCLREDFAHHCKTCTETGCPRK